jgi:hypothetical protein
MIRVSVFALTAAIAAASLVVPASAKSSQFPGAAHHSGPPYDVIPQGAGAIRRAINSDDPSLTGGGSAGYNQMIYNW